MPTDARYRFYAAEISYFSAKPRPALRYKHVPFDEILPTKQAYQGVIRPRTGLSQIPVLVTPGDEVIQDSSIILDELERRFPEPPLYPRTPAQRMLGYLLEIYDDEFLLLSGVHYRWSFEESRTKGVADFVASSGDPDSAMKFAESVQGFTHMVGVSAATVPPIEAHTRELLGAFDAHLAVHPYVLGARPSLGDCALIGLLYPHLYLDAVPGKLIREIAIRVCHWIERMNHPDPLSFGEWLPNDAIPPTMRPIVELAGRDAIPFILDVARAFETWAESTSVRDGFLPRIVGMHRTSLRGVEFDRITTPYTMWMVQRVTDVYRGMTPAERAAVDAAFAGTGMEPLLAYVPRWRVRRSPCRLVLEPPAGGG
jgi:glutathione S-transferase